MSLSVQTGKRLHAISALGANKPVPYFISRHMGDLNRSYAPLWCVASTDGRVMVETAELSIHSRTGLSFSTSIVLVVPPGFPDEIPAGFYVPRQQCLGPSGRNVKERTIGPVDLLHFCIE